MHIADYHSSVIYIKSY